jgi:protein SCO1/2
VLATVLLLAAALPALAQQGRPPALRDVGYDQRLGAALPLDAAFKDESGRDVRLSDYFGKRPVVLSFVYYGCPMLCTLTLDGLAGALSTLSLDAGKEFEVVTVSFDPQDTPAAAAKKKQAYMARYKRDSAQAGWHFLTGKAEDIARLTGAVGFRYAWDAETRQFAHPAGVVVATPAGRISRYLFGIEYAPRDLRLALVESATEKIGNPIDALALFCYSYDPMTGRYGMAIMRILRVAGVLTVLALGGFVLTMLRRERAGALAGRAG